MIQINQAVIANKALRFGEPLSLSIEDGEQVAIVGGNGSGKTTVAHILTGRYPLSSGSVIYGFAPAPVYNNVKFIAFRDSYGTADASYYLQQRYNSQDCEASPLVTLSSGEMRIYQIFKAIQSFPKALIIDSPYIGLDVEARTMLTELLESLTPQMQIILLLARRDEVPAFVNRVIDLNGVANLNEEVNLNGRLENLNKVQNLVKVRDDVKVQDKVEEPVIEMRDVTIRYGGKTILQNINWTVRRGEKWAVVGKNGSGKSTLLSLVCADNPQGYACDISLFGRRRGSGESIWDVKKRIGYVSPEMHRAYRENIPTKEIVASGLFDSVGLHRRANAAQLQQCERWMALFGIEHLKDRSFMQLSDGEQRLALLARAFVKDPELLILDEPFHGLDEENLKKAGQIIEEFASRDGKTLVMVSHWEREIPLCIKKRLFLKNLLS